MLLPVGLAVLGAVLVLLQNHTYGPGLHWDSVNYIGVARSLLAGEGFTQFGGLTYNAWPPLYPILLAMPGLLFGIDPHAAAGPLNALLFGLTVFAAARWLLERITSRWLALWGGGGSRFLDIPNLRFILGAVRIRLHPLCHNGAVLYGPIPA